MTKNSVHLAFLLFLLPLAGWCQPMEPGFSQAEYSELLKVTARQINLAPELIRTPAPEKFRFKYRSPEVGLQNQWDLWVDDNRRAVIGIRGTTKDIVSWLANFYAAMVPAKGSLQLSRDYIFNYHLADDDKAAVHTGWLIGAAALSRDIIPKIDSLYKSGVKNFFIIGHSQGGAIAYLLTSHLYHLKTTGVIPNDIIFKTYCSGAPKPGNLFYAYEFEAITGDGWAFNVVNAADWVPEMPASVQTIKDYNNVNPFVNALPVIKKQKAVQRFFLKRAYKRLSGPPKKSQEEYVKYLGDKMFELIRKQLPEFVKPVYFESMNYVRTGKTIVLMPDDGYRKLFPDDQKHLFIHHLFEPYFYLIGNRTLNSGRSPDN